ncbi:MAG: hypothetical protein ACREJC_17050 [Tepidisphaeraceae bacterium]
MDWAVTNLHTSPWKTNFVNYPAGSSLLAHTLSPLNGLAAIPLSRFLPQVVVFNTIHVLAFVLSGMTAFWLAYYLSRNILPSLAAGYIFTFSSYHWAHGQGHLQLTAMQWIPLFLLAWVRFLDGPSFGRAAMAVAALLLVELCDFYYLLYCVLAGMIFLMARLTDATCRPLLLTRRSTLALVVFALGALACCGSLPIALAALNRSDPLLGSHPAADFSTDLLAPLIASPEWRFSRLTYWYWSGLGENLSEISVSLGLAALTMAIYGWLRRRRNPAMHAGTWAFVGLTFYLLSLGPVLHVCGRPVMGRWMPYSLLEMLIPPLRLSGCPSRMMVMTTLCTAVLAAAGLAALAQVSRFARRIVWLVFAVLLVVESIPRDRDLTSAQVPNWVVALRDLPDGAILDVTPPPPGRALFYQTVHRKPMAFGYISRLQRSVAAQNQRIRDLVTAGRFRPLVARFGIRYLLTDGRDEPPARSIVFDEPGRRIIDLGVAFP